MYLQLMRRQRGVQRPVKQVWLPCTLDQMMYPEGGLNETMLLNMIPEGWLPAKPGEVLVSLAYPTGSTGLRNLQIFHPWERHFTCYVLELWHEEPHG